MLPKQSDWTSGSHVKQPEEPMFLGDSGIRVQMPIDSKPMEYLRLIIDENFISLMVQQTNLYAMQFIEKSSVKSSPVSLWKDVDSSDIWNFLGLSILMGIDYKPSIPMYWSKD